MGMKFSFAGFRHGHIHALLNLVKSTPGLEIVGAFEDDLPTCESLEKNKAAVVTHHDFDAMIAETECDAVAVGDYYGRRGALIIKALSAGKHVISDKPICTSADELDQIEAISRSRNLKVGCMFDLRDQPQFICVRSLIQSGRIGEIHAVSFGGQHPLAFNSRPAWYFEAGKHGGTINDIAVHALDLIPWITGHKFKRIVAARCWNALAKRCPHFKDAAQLMLEMDNGAGVMGDVSYFTPDSHGYSLPQYWRMTFWGSEGVIESSCNMQCVFVAINGEIKTREEPLPEGTPGNYLKAFLKDIAGNSEPGDLDTDAVISASRIALLAQKSGDSCDGRQPETFHGNIS